MDDDERCTNHEIDVQNKALLLDECVHSFKREMMGLMAGVQNSDAESFIVSFPDAVSDLMSSLEQLSESKRDCYRLFMDKQFSSVCKVMEDCLTNLEDMLSSDFDLLLAGDEESNLSIEEWKSYTIYEGYEEGDPQISWFWEITEDMTVDRRRSLLFFWTSQMYLPLEGFAGLDRKLKISKSMRPESLPMSKTCIPLLFLPPYPSKEVMESRLSIITGEFSAGGFGLD